MKNSLLIFAALCMLAVTGCNQSNTAEQNPPANTNTASQNIEEGASNAWQGTKEGASNAWGAVKDGSTNAWNEPTNAAEDSSTNQ